MPDTPVYDRIGATYSQRRRSDPQIARAVWTALGTAGSVLNVGAGTGSYEPTDRVVVAVEPSAVMIAQRRKEAAPAVQARGEHLPFRSGSFDAVMATLTLHHWSDQVAGLRECARVARRRIVVLTWDAEADGFWLLKDYFPEFAARDRQHFPPMGRYATMLAPEFEVQVSAVSIPRDCCDGFLGAFWARPAAYLDPEVQTGMSSFANADAHAGLARLRDDLDTGEWQRRHGHLLALPELDIGYRLVVAMRRHRAS